VAAAVKRGRARCMRFLGHRIHPLESVELRNRATIELQKTSKQKCRSFIKTIAVTYAWLEQSDRIYMEKWILHPKITRLSNGSCLD
jgi:hypothetical protein